MYLLPHAIHRSADRDPHAVAFRFRGRDLSYEELVRRTDCLALTLREHGLRRRDRVGVFMNKSLELPVAVYGAMKAAGAYVPLDPPASAA